MPDPILSNSFPAHGSVGVASNINLIVELSCPLLSTSLDTGTVCLIDQSTKLPVPHAVEFDGANRITLRPAEALNDFTSYQILLVGTDINSPSGSIVAYDSTPMSQSINIEFQTARVHVSSTDETVVSDLNNDGYDDVTVTVVDPSGEISSVNYRKFAFLPAESAPYDGTLMVSPSYLVGHGMRLKFTTDIDELSLEDNLNIEVRPLINLRSMVSSMTELQCNYNPTYSKPVCDPIMSASGQYCPENRLAQTKPDFLYSVSGEYLTITIDESVYAYNQEIIIELGANISTTEDYGLQTLGEKKYYNIATGLFPFYAEIEAVRSELRELNVMYTDYAISRLITKNSLESWTMGCMGFDICNPPWFAIDYTLYKTLMDLYDLSQFKRLQSHNVKKSLGDFSVQYGNANRYPIPKEAKTDAKVSELADLLHRLCGSSMMRGAVKGATSGLQPWPAMRKRTWKRFNADGRDNVGNTISERDAKLPAVNEFWS